MEKNCATMAEHTSEMLNEISEMLRYGCQTGPFRMKNLATWHVKKMLNLSTSISKNLTNAYHIMF